MRKRKKKKDFLRAPKSITPGSAYLSFFWFGLFFKRNLQIVNLLCLNSTFSISQVQDLDFYFLIKNKGFENFIFKT